jgi:FixJ family two-component response regulator
VPRAPLIVIVDDDAAVRKAITSLVESAGFESASFGSAEECLGSNRLADSACLILDVRMPGMSGLELQSHLLARDEVIPIIFISAHGENGARAQASQAGAAAFLAKPFGHQELLDAIDSALGKS